MLTNANIYMSTAGSAAAALVSPARNGVDKTLCFGTVLALAGRCAR